MRTTYLYFAFLFLLFFCSTTSLSQEKKVSKKDVISLNLTRLILLEARIGYERALSEKNVVRAVVGFQFPTGSESFQNVNYVPFHYYVSQGVYLGIGYNYIVKPKTGFYISAELYYQYSYFNDKYYVNCAGTSRDSQVSLQSQVLNKTGLKILAGKKLSFLPKRETKVRLDIFGGFGMQYRQEEITKYKSKMGECSIDGQYEYQYYNPPSVSEENKWYPTLHFGLAMYIPF